MANARVYINTLAQIAGKFSTALISVFLIGILTNYLTPGEYGLYNKIYNYLSIFATIADVGLYAITVREISAHRDDGARVERIFGNVMTIRALSGVAVIFLALGIACLIPGYDSPVALVSVFVTGLFTLFGLLNSSIMSLLQAHLRSEFSFVSTTVGKLANFAGILLVTFVLFPAALLAAHPEWRDQAFVAVMLAGLAGNVVMAGLLYWYARRTDRIVFRFDRETALSLLRESAPYGLALFLGIVYFKVDVVIISLLEPHPMADTSIALYSVPMKIVEVGIMLATLFLNSMLPVFTRLARDGDQEGFSAAFRKAYLVLLAGAVFAGAYVHSLGREILLALSNATYADRGIAAYSSLDAFRVVAVIFVFSCLAQLFTFILVAYERQRRLLVVNIVLAIVNIVGNFLLVPRYSFIGSAFMTVASQALLMGLTYAVAHRFAPLRVPVLPTLWIIAAGLCAVWIMPFLVPLLPASHFVRLVLGGAVLAVVFAVSLAPLAAARVLARVRAK